MLDKEIKRQKRQKWIAIIGGAIASILFIAVK
jgi:hypothetical protein